MNFIREKFERKRRTDERSSSFKDYMITDDELMNDLNKWLTTPELQHRPNAGLIELLASIHKQYRTKGRITERQRKLS